MKRIRLDPYSARSNDAIEEAIRLWIKKDRDRVILKMKLVDGLTYEDIAEKVDMSPKGVQKIVYRAEDILFKHLDIQR